VESLPSHPSQQLDPKGTAAVGRFPLGRFIAVAVACGVVLTGMLLPAAGGIALAARDSTQSFESLPAILNAPSSTTKTLETDKLFTPRKPPIRAIPTKTGTPSTQD